MSAILLGRPLARRSEKAKTPRGEFEAFTQEDLALLYLRQARTALVTLAVLAVAGVLATIVLGIVGVIVFAHENEVRNHLIHNLH